MTPVETAIVTAAANAGAGAVFKSAADHIEKTIRGPAKIIAIKALAALTGYSSYIEETNNRVSTFKTFADPTKPVSLFSHFVETKFKFPGVKNPINQDQLLKRITNSSRIVVSATAGYGKSMVMRYLALAMFEHPSGRIPIFVELRNLNRISVPDILAFIHSSYRQSSPVQIESFKQALTSGSIVLLLDGFDELNFEIRSLIEKQIIELSNTYPKSSFVISGRPDDRFRSWVNFSICKVEPMGIKQVIDLINRLDYDKGVRQRFITKIRNGLYDSHKSFMSTPLLAILMLLTFEQNANIPDKMHLFYSEAFRTLFHKHDALKEQYDRSRRSGMPVDEFEKVFSVFCLHTYVLEKLEFTEKEIAGYINKALIYDGASCISQNFLFDLEESVCLLVKEGSSYFFVHRSFQEYFTALFLSSCPENIRDEFIEKISTRYWDNVLPMLFEISGEQIVSTWIIPRAKVYLENVGFIQDKTSPIAARFTGVNFRRINNGNFKVRNFDFGDHWKFIAVMMRFYHSVGAPAPDLELTFDPLDRWFNSNKKHEFENADHVYLALNAIPEEVLMSTGLTAMANAEHDEICKIAANLDTQYRNKTEFLRNLFGSE